MPIYEYECGKCGAGFEALIRSKKDIPSQCPKCGAGNIKKALSTFAVSTAAAHSHGGEACETCPSAGATCSSGKCPFST